jgi:hypothetical protein
MEWFTSSLAVFLGTISAHGRMVGDEAGLWAAIGVLFIAIFLIGGGLLAFLIKAARANDSPNGRHHSDPGSFQ